MNLFFKIVRSELRSVKSGMNRAMQNQELQAIGITTTLSAAAVFQGWCVYKITRYRANKKFEKQNRKKFFGRFLKEYYQMKKKHESRKAMEQWKKKEAITDA